MGIDTLPDGIITTYNDDGTTSEEAIAGEDLDMVKITRDHIGQSIGTVDGDESIDELPIEEVYEDLPTLPSLSDMKIGEFETELEKLRLNSNELKNLARVFMKEGLTEKAAILRERIVSSEISVKDRDVEKRLLGSKPAEKPQATSKQLSSAKRAILKMNVPTKNEFDGDTDAYNKAVQGYMDNIRITASKNGLNSIDLENLRKSIVDNDLDQVNGDLTNKVILNAAID
ncbi:MAG: hypothetical protein Q9M91_05820 [Candidatus Dojkabacteria bacterium]|nr:hypothetical protein [Candidatus Dojkabacteria bacterium]MDQ7021317.1 hypothetical protein [Candidatus Dojkabacteria bacterium]